MSLVLYVLGKHLPWSGLDWDAGDDVLAAEVEATLNLCGDLGVRVCLDLEVQGLQHLAAGAPQCLARLAAAVRAGDVELTGTSYAQPFGLFHGGESGVRQRVLGVRSIAQLIGTRPRTALSQAFDFYPQLPQILASTGHEGAVLCFPWTRSTPVLGLEQDGALVWEGLDGTRLRALAPARLDVRAPPAPTAAQIGEWLARAQRASDEKKLPLVVMEWLPEVELDDLGRARPLLLEHVREFALASGGQFRAVTASEALLALGARAGAALGPGLEPVYHGVSLGKNGDYMPRYSRMCEEQLLAAESLAALAGLLGRPYAGRNVYPSWELGESWRELLAAQHHSVHEREAASGPVGERSFERSLALSSEVFLRTLEHVGRRVDAVEGSTLVCNTLGWTRDVPHHGGVVRDVPAWGYKVVDPYESDAIVESRLGPIRMTAEEDTCTLTRGRFQVEINRRLGVVNQVYAHDFPQGLLRPGQSLGAFQMRREGKWEKFPVVHFSGDTSEENEYAEFQFVREGRGGSKLRVTFGLSPLHDALWVRLQADSLARPDPGVAAALSSAVHVGFEPLVLLHDHPFGVSDIAAQHDFVRHYPGPADRGLEPADQSLWQETVPKPFTALSLVDLCEGGAAGRGLMLVHDGSQSMLRETGGLRNVLSMYDPWDEDVYDNVIEAEMWLVPHGPWTNTERMKVAMECNVGSPRFEDFAPARGGGDMPASFGSLTVDSQSVLPTAFYRESARAAAKTERHFGSGPGPVRDPYVLRLVEFDGRAADVVVRMPGPIARAARTNLLGEVLCELQPTTARAPFGPSQMPWSAVRLQMGPREIATLYFDLELGRQAPTTDHKLAANLPAKRRGRK